jgi:hypothetical protein
MYASDSFGSDGFGADAAPGVRGPRRLRGVAGAGAALTAALALAGGGLSAAASGDDRPAQARPAAPTSTLSFVTSSPALAACFPYAKAAATVRLTTDAVGKDTFTIKASGLRPETAFTLFIIEQAASPFGAVEYFGDITTDRWGNAKNSFTLIAEEAFAFNNVTKKRTELNSVGFWFADPADDDACLGAASPVTQFDGDDSAGVQMMNSGVTVLP